MVNKLWFSHIMEYTVMCAQSCLTLCDPMDCIACRLLCPLSFPGKNTGVGCHFFLQIQWNTTQE